jgi:hypothetical protein
MIVVKLINGKQAYRKGMLVFSPDISGIAKLKSLSGGRLFMTYTTQIWKGGFL